MSPTRPAKPRARPATKRKEAVAADRRGEIRHAAYRCFSAEGYHGTTVDKICLTLGISKGAFYWYFAGKQELFLDILNDWAGRVEADMARGFRHSLAGPDRLDSMAKAIQKETRRGRYIMPIWVEFLAQVARIPPLREGLGRFHRRIRGFIRGILDPTLPAVFDDEQRDALATVVLACFIGLVCLGLADPEKTNTEQTVRRFMTVLDHYITPGRALRPERG